MKTIQICISTIEKVKDFVNDVSKFENELDLVSGKYVIDAKSIMGIFSLDITKPLTLNIHGSENVDKIIEKLSVYTV